jgi:phospholipase/carboxylesterase
VSEIKTFKSGRLDEANAETPLVLFLHGYGADERDLPDLMSFLPDLPWASLRAPEPSQYGGYAWFPIETPLNPSPRLVEPATQAIWDWVDEFLTPETKLIVIGFSQGGLMTTQLLRNRPERIKGAVILAGFVMDSPQPADETLTKTKPKVIYCRGLQDGIVTSDAVAKLNTWLQTHTKAITRAYDGLGHSIDQRVMNDVADYVSLVNS